MSCTCEPGVELRQPHAPWLCQQNPGWDQDFDPDCDCSHISLVPGCVVHKHLIPLADGTEVAA